MQITITGKITQDSALEDEIEVTQVYEDYGQTPHPAKVEEIVLDLTTKVGRKLVAARVA